MIPIRAPNRSRPLRLRRRCAAWRAGAPLAALALLLARGRAGRWAPSLNAPAAAAARPPPLRGPSAPLAPRSRPPRAPFQASAAPRPGASPASASASASAPAAAAAEPPPRSARAAALAFYAAYNARRLGDALDLLAPDVVYEDLVYLEPFRGRAAVAAYFAALSKSVPDDVRFVVEGVTGGEGDLLLEPGAESGTGATSTVGVRWRVEVDGAAPGAPPVPFPFSRGVSFYEVNARGEIAFARDVVEPSLKPGAAALGAIAALAPAVRRLGPLADPRRAAAAPLGAAAVAAFWGWYCWYFLM